LAPSARRRAEVEHDLDVAVGFASEVAVFAVDEELPLFVYFE
jgi:hypothetical protein